MIKRKNKKKSFFINRITKHSARRHRLVGQRHVIELQEGLENDAERVEMNSGLTDLLKAAS